jgi:hypothetical protein
MYCWSHKEASAKMALINEHACGIFQKNIDMTDFMIV